MKKIQQPHDIYTNYDEMGGLLGLTRRDNEDNVDYRARLIGVFKNRAGVNEQGMVDAISRELGLDRYNVVDKKYFVLNNIPDINYAVTVSIDGTPYTPQLIQTHPLPSGWAPPVGITPADAVAYDYVIKDSSPAGWILWRDDEGEYTGILEFLETPSAGFISVSYTYKEDDRFYTIDDVDTDITVDDPIYGLPGMYKAYAANTPSSTQVGVYSLNDDDFLTATNGMVNTQGIPLPMLRNVVKRIVDASPIYWGNFIWDRSPWDAQDAETLETLPSLMDADIAGYSSTGSFTDFSAGVGWGADLFPRRVREVSADITYHNNVFQNEYCMNFDINDENWLMGYPNIGVGLPANAGAWSMSVWFNSSGFPGGKQVIAGRMGSTSLYTYGEGIAIASGTHVYATYDSGAGTPTGWNHRLKYAVGADTWYHAVCTFSGLGADNTGNLYINGTGQASWVGTTYSTNTDHIFGVGAGLWLNGSVIESGVYFGGAIDEVGVWNKELDADEVATLYGSGFAGDLNKNYGNYTSSSDLQAWYRLGDETWRQPWNVQVNNATGVPWATGDEEILSYPGFEASGDWTQTSTWDNQYNWIDPVKNQFVISRPERTDHAAAGIFQQLPGFVEGVLYEFIIDLDYLRFTGNSALRVYCPGNYLDFGKSASYIVIDEDLPKGVYSWLIRYPTSEELGKTPNKNLVILSNIPGNPGTCYAAINSVSVRRINGDAHLHTNEMDSAGATELDTLSTDVKYPMNNIEVYNTNPWSVETHPGYFYMSDNEYYLFRNKGFGIRSTTQYVGTTGFFHLNAMKFDETVSIPIFLTQENVDWNASIAAGVPWTKTYEAPIGYIGSARTPYAMKRVYDMTDIKDQQWSATGAIPFTWSLEDGEFYVDWGLADVSGFYYPTVWVNPLGSYLVEWENPGTTGDYTPTDINVNPTHSPWTQDKFISVSDMENVATNVVLWAYGNGPVDLDATGLYGVYVEGPEGTPLQNTAVSVYTNPPGIITLDTPLLITGWDGSATGSFITPAVGTAFPATGVVLSAYPVHDGPTGSIIIELGITKTDTLIYG